ncbi:MAG TPA: PKD domain-containing protein [Nitrososphaeraceae archaeon]|nr:PKD domain-containing protein [Nitrososphaeraceae archaeon]
MSRQVKLAIIFSAIGAAVAIGIIVAIVYNQTVGEIFLHLAGEKDDEDSSNNLNSAPTLGFITHYKAVLAVGEEGTYSADSKFGKAPFSFEWKFSDGLILTGQKVSRSYDLPGRYSFYLTVSDSTGKQVTSTELNTNVVQETAKKENVTANATPTRHN